MGTSLWFTEQKSTELKGAGDLKWCFRRRHAERKLLNTGELQTLGIPGILTGEVWVKEF